MSIAPAVDPLIQTKLGKYVVLQQIGQGGMGTVYLVEHENLRKRFAAKVLSQELTANEEAKARFLAEAYAASELEHENVINLTDYGYSDDGRPYIVMEFLKGQTLAERIAAGPMRIDEMIAVVIPAAQGLGAAHEAGVVHRDVKPENIFLVARGNGLFSVKVLDFGIAKAPRNNALTKMGQAIGSPAYMAPEACAGEEVDTRADIYSLGVVMYQLFCGSVPFDDENILKILHRHVYDALPAPRSRNPQIDARLEQILIKTLAKDRNDRYQRIDDLLDDLESALPAENMQLLEAARRVAAGRKSNPALPTVRASGNYTASSSSDALSPLHAPSLRADTTLRVDTVPSGAAATPAPAAGLTVAPAPRQPARRNAIGYIVGAVLLIGGGIGVVVLSRPGTRASVASTNDPSPQTSVSAGVVTGERAVPPMTPNGAVPSASAKVVPLDGSAGPAIELARPASETPAGTPVPAALLGPAQPPTVTLTIASSPENATVRLNGKLVGRTPLTLEQPRSDDRVTLVLSHAGYADESRSLVLNDDAEWQTTLLKVSQPIVRAQPPRKMVTPPNVDRVPSVRPVPASSGLEIRTTR